MRSLKVIGIVLCVLISLCISVNVESWRRARLDRRHAASLDTAAAVLDLYIAILETESGQRGYIITGNVLDAEDYYAGADRVRAAREKLSVYMAAGATDAQLHELAELDKVLGQKLSEMASTIEAVHDHGPAAAVTIVKNQQGLRMMKHLRAIKDSLVASTRSEQGGRDAR